MYQSGRAGDEAKKCKAPTKSGGVGITEVRLMTYLSTDQNRLSGASGHCFCRTLSGDVNIVRRKFITVLVVHSSLIVIFLCMLYTREERRKQLFCLASKQFCRTRDFLCLQLNYEPTAYFRVFILILCFRLSKLKS